jgi:hypothetical protein
MDEGLGSADFLDELIPPGWATGGQHSTPIQPQNGDGTAGANRRSHAENGDQPQTPATAEPGS